MLNIELESGSRVTLIHGDELLAVEALSRVMWKDSSLQNRYYEQILRDPIRLESPTDRLQITHDRSRVRANRRSDQHWVIVEKALFQL